MNQAGAGAGKGAARRRCGGLYLYLRKAAGAAAHLSALAISVYVGVLSRLGTSESFLLAPSLHVCGSLLLYD